jgi:hypothetical protein
MKRGLPHARPEQRGRSSAGDSTSSGGSRPDYASEADLS